MKIDPVTQVTDQVQSNQSRNEMEETSDNETS
jgi:hypothetical protein